MRSCDRDASLARALIRVVMTLGAGQSAPGGGGDDVTSNSTASNASKQEVMSLTEQRESHDTERYSPSTHTWKSKVMSVSDFIGTFYNLERYFTMFQHKGEDLYKCQNTQKGKRIILKSA